ncbi:MAG: 16S rRNA (guanine(527)-N(7))-methyltransferase RsmG [Pseudomonadota bacterium]
MICPPDWLERDVSRETLEALAHYGELIRKWTHKINLVSHNTLSDLETRHIWDSAQIFNADSGKLVDVGSGAGLPGVVLAILRKGDGISGKTVLIESDQRKCAFLRTCARELGLDVDIIASRIEAAEPQSADIFCARALASLTVLLGFAERHLNPGGYCIFQKGAAWRDEIDAAHAKWRFSYEWHASKTNPEAATLVVRDIERV